MAQTSIHLTRTIPAALALSLALALGGCGGMATNRTLNSVHQPIVDRSVYTFDVSTTPDSLSLSEQQRVVAWFDSLGLRYGDNVSIDDPAGAIGTRAALASIAARYGLALADGRIVTPGYVTPGNARIVVTRTSARVPGCPDWSTKSDTNFKNATSSNYGCATNSNVAAMVANPEHLIQGATGQGGTVVMSASKAIGSYREAKPTGEAGLAKTSTSEGN